MGNWGSYSSRLGSDTVAEGYATRLHTLVRIGGTAAILAGVLRALASFASGTGETELQVLYFIVDLLLLLGVLAAVRTESSGFGLLGCGRIFLSRSRGSCW